MQIKYFQKPLIILTAVFSLAACSDDDDGEDIPVSEIPVNIINRVQNTLPGIAIDEAEKETKDKRVTYELEGKMTDGKRYEIKIREDGTILEIELEDEPENEQSKGQVTQGYSDSVN